MSQNQSPRWGLIEVFGRRRHFGLVSTVLDFGATVIRVEVPWADPDRGFRNVHMYAPSAFFSFTEMSETEVRAAAKQAEPYHAQLSSGPFRPPPENWDRDLDSDDEDEDEEPVVIGADEDDEEEAAPTSTKELKLKIEKLAEDIAAHDWETNGGLVPPSQPPVPNSRTDEIEF